MASQTTNVFDIAKRLEELTNHVNDLQQQIETISKIVRPLTHPPPLTGDTSPRLMSIGDGCCEDDP